VHSMTMCISSRGPLLTHALSSPATHPHMVSGTQETLVYDEAALKLGNKAAKGSTSASEAWYTQ